MAAGPHLLRDGRDGLHGHGAGALRAISRAAFLTRPPVSKRAAIRVWLRPLNMLAGSGAAP